jgi:dTDP-4-dehydrorhamnose reductase
MSSTGVYGDWKTTPYCEEDVCRPTSFHHKCKLEAENYIQKNLNQYFILRLGWIFSSKFSNSNHDFISKIQSLLRKSEELITNDIQKGVPTPTSLVDEVIEHVINLEEIDSDIINVVSSGSASRTEYIKEVQNVFGTEVDITGSNTFERTAKVSNNETATNEKLSNFLNNEIHTWQSYLKRIEK